MLLIISGPSGAGKTHLATVITQSLEGQDSFGMHSVPSSLRSQLDSPPISAEARDLGVKILEIDTTRFFRRGFRSARDNWINIFRRDLASRKSGDCLGREIQESEFTRVIFLTNTYKTTRKAWSDRRLLDHNRALPQGWRDLYSSGYLLRPLRALAYYLLDVRFILWVNQRLGQASGESEVNCYVRLRGGYLEKVTMRSVIAKASEFWFKRKRRVEEVRGQIYPGQAGRNDS